MNDSAIFLRELQPCFLALPPEDVDFLRAHYARHIALQPHISGTSWQVTPGQVCGVIPLPSGRTLHIEPRISIRGVWQMLAWCWDLAELGERLTPRAGVSDLVQGIMGTYVRELWRLIQRGIAFGYSLSQDNLAVVRGRIDIRRQIHVNAGARHRFACVFDELSINTPENRVLLAALDLVPTGLVQHDRRLGSLIRRCRTELAAFVSAMSRNDLAAARVPPHAPHYRVPLALARLLIHACGPRHRPATQPAPTLLVEMPELFERFVCEVVRRKLPPELRLRQSGHSVALDEEHRTLLTPDAVVERNGIPSCIIDAKYKLRGEGTDTEGGREPSAPDLYQMLAYCVGYRARHAVLVYPEVCDTPPLRIERGMVRARVHQLGVDLAGGPRELEASCDALCARVTELAREVEESARDVFVREPDDRCGPPLIAAAVPVLPDRLPAIQVTSHRR